MGEKKAVLVVDDEEQFQMLMEDALGDDYTVLRAELIQDGYRLFCEHRDCVQAILMDGNMPLGPPEMRTTVDLVRRIRSEGFSGTIVAISSEEDLQKKLCEAGCNVTLTKPFRMEQLLSMLGRV